MNDIRCADCGKTPSELSEYIDAGRENGMSPEAYVRQEEGTYDAASGRFLCTADFIEREVTTGRRILNGDT